MEEIALSIRAISFSNDIALVRLGQYEVSSTSSQDDMVLFIHITLPDPTWNGSQITVFANFGLP
jgi:hypothetical protein